jgi:arsenate reductase
MAEAFLKQLGGDRFDVESAGIERGSLNFNVVKVMAEVCIDISNNESKEVFDLFRQGRMYDAVVTVCDAANERCPIFPGMVRRISWSFPDPSTFMGTEEVVLQQTRRLRDEIKEKVTEFIVEASELNYWMHEEAILIKENMP